MSDSQTKSILSLLPPRRYTSLRTEPDCYGASYLLSLRARLPFVPRSLAHWQHGWIYNNLDIQFPQIFGIPSNYPFLVATTKHSAYLASCGIKSIPVGHPLTYASLLDTIDIPTIPNSILFMPPHGLEYTTENWSETDILESFIRTSTSYSYIAACIHPDSVKKGQWIHQLNKFEIPYFLGAEMQDSNSLTRMVRMLSSFSAVAACSMGSHIAYAAFCGCTVNIIEPFCEWHPQYLKSDELFKNYPEILEYFIWLYSKRFAQQNFPFLFSSLYKQKADFSFRAWARDELGHSNIISIRDLSRLLGWRPIPQLKDMLSRSRRFLHKNLAT